ncbi:MAG: DNA polymerase Y family protein [Deltaproteobacteria bacterium]
MTRHACICIPRFPVAALHRAEPELRGTPLVLTAAGRSSSPESLILALSLEAERRGAAAGMTLAQALSRHADLVVRTIDPGVLRGAQDALWEAALATTPHVELPDLEEDATQFVYLDASGLERLVGSAGGLAAALSARVARVGFLPGLGVADRMETAQVAAELGAHRRGAAILVCPGGDRAWLAQRPLVALRPPPEVGEWLAEVGIITIGALAEVARAEVGTRLGRAGIGLWLTARGEGRRVLRPRAPGLELVEGIDMEWGVESLEALLFLLRGVLDRLLARLEVRSLAVAGLELRLALAGGGEERRKVGVLAPTREAKTLLRLLRSALEGTPPTAAVESVALVAHAGEARPEQLDLFRPAGPPPAQLAGMLARLAAICGEERVGRPVAPPGHRPEAVGLAPFRPPPAAAVEVGARLPRGGPPAPRALRPPMALRVETQQGRPVGLRSASVCGQVRICAGPWRIEAEWWKADPCRRDYFNVHLDDGALLRIYRRLDAPVGAALWFLDGIYD